jgi:hypothetical protein
MLGLRSKATDLQDLVYVALLELVDNSTMTTSLHPKLIYVLIVEKVYQNAAISCLNSNDPSFGFIPGTSRQHSTADATSYVGSGLLKLDI